LTVCFAKEISARTGFEKRIRVSSVFHLWLKIDSALAFPPRAVHPGFSGWPFCVVFPGSGFAGAGHAVAQHVHIYQRV
jgi:hypothetical protein